MSVPLGPERRDEPRPIKETSTFGIVQLSINSSHPVELVSTNEHYVMNVVLLTDDLACLVCLEPEEMKSFAVSVPVPASEVTNLAKGVFDYWNKFKHPGEEIDSDMKIMSAIADGNMTGAKFVEEGGEPLEEADQQRLAMRIASAMEQSISIPMESIREAVEIVLDNSEPGEFSFISFQLVEKKELQVDGIIARPSLPISPN